MKGKYCMVTLLSMCLINTVTKEVFEALVDYNFLKQKRRLSLEFGTLCTFCILRRCKISDTS